MNHFWKKDLRSRVPERPRGGGPAGGEPWTDPLLPPPPWNRLCRGPVGVPPWRLPPATGLGRLFRWCPGVEAGLCGVSKDLGEPIEESMGEKGVVVLLAKKLPEEAVDAMG